MKRKAILKFIRYLLFFTVLVFLTFWFIFKNQNMEELMNIVGSSNKLYIFLGAIFMFLFFLMEALNVRKLLSYFGEKISIIKALKFTFICFFFSSITPASTGGEPVETYYMSKEKISAAKGALALLIKLCGYQIATITIGIICAILNPNVLNNGLIWLFLLGVTVNGISVIFMLIFIFSQKLTNATLNICMKILNHFKFKKIDKIKNSIEIEVKKYSESSIFIKSHKKEFFKSILMMFVQISFYYMVPFFVYKSFGLNNHNILQLYAIQAILYCTVSGLPLPGSVGISETVFLGIYGIAFGETLLSGAMLLTRGITFYLYVILSLIVVLINALRMKDIPGEINDPILALDNGNIDEQK